MAILNSC